MKNLFKVSLFVMGVVLASGAMAATGTGHSQAELLNPLTVVNEQNVLFGTISIDPAAGPQTLSMNPSGFVTCPATYICLGPRLKGAIRLTGAPYVTVNVSVAGSTAILSDGAGKTLVFDPILSTSGLDTDTLNIGTGSRLFNINGSIDFTGDESAGTYSTSNAGGSGYQITVSY